MSAENGAFELLGQSADWLRDCDNSTLGELRMRAVERLDSCWRRPGEKGVLRHLEDAIVVLFQGLYFNQAYPPDAPFFVHAGVDDPRNFLPRDEYILADAHALANLIVTNKLGVGEVHLAYLLTLLRKRILENPDDEEALKVEEEARNWLYLRSPKYREMNMGDFSENVRQRFNALAPTRIVRRIEAMGDDLTGALPMAERLRIIERMAPLGAVQIDGCAPKPYRMPFLILELIGALEENVRARSEGRECREPRSARRVSSALAKCWSALRTEETTPLPVRLRLANLILTELALAIPRTEERVGRRIYAKLRSRTEETPPVRHKALFEALPSDDERLTLLNFLLRAGGKAPEYYIERFGEYFEHFRPEFDGQASQFKLVPL